MDDCSWFPPYVEKNRDIILTKRRIPAMCPGVISVIIMDSKRIVRYLGRNLN